MANSEFVIQKGTEKLFKRKAEVESWFGVKIRAEPSADKGIVWVYIEAGNDESLALSKTYIESLCEAKHSKTVSVSRELYENLRRSPGFIEKQCGAVLEFPSPNSIFLRGTEVAVVIAESIIEEKQRQVAKGRDTSQSTSTGLAAAPVEPQLPRPLFDFARRLGFSREEIDLVVRKYGPAINQDKLLKELMQCRPRSSAGRRSQQPTSSVSPRGAVSSSINDPILARGCSRPLRVPPSVEADGSYEDVGFAPASSNLRPIIIDGSNVAMEHGNQQVFSCRGIRICVDWFRRRGHTDVTVFVPSWRVDVVRPDITNQEVLHELNRAGILKFTPCKTSGSRQFVCYDDRFILDLATNTGGIVVSNDRFRDLQKESTEWIEVIEERVLRYTFAMDRFMPPSDPLGRMGPCLDDFLRKGTATHPRICPYLNNCTYGLQCKFYHPERDEQRVISAQRFGSVDGSEPLQPHSGDFYGYQMYPRVPLCYNSSGHDCVDGHGIMESDVCEKYQKLKEIFPQLSEESIKDAIRNFPHENTDLLAGRLTDNLPSNL